MWRQPASSTSAQKYRISHTSMRASIAQQNSVEEGCCQRPGCSGDGAGGVGRRDSSSGGGSSSSSNSCDTLEGTSFRVRSFLNIVRTYRKPKLARQGTCFYRVVRRYSYLIPRNSCSSAVHHEYMASFALNLGK